ncbi:MAG: ABC transporter substrate-binding protein [Betaproteobacteria bacterium]
MHGRRGFLAGAGALGSVPLAARAQARRQDARADAPRTLRYPFEIAETTFDPAAIQDGYSRQITGHIFEAPLEYDYYARPARLVPCTLAALPEASADFRSFTLRLRPGILFADDPAFGGQPRELVAADYVYAWKRLYDPRWKSPMLFQLEPSRLLGLDELRQQALKSRTPFDYDRPVDGLRALDRYTLQIRLAEPAPRFVFLLADASIFGAVAREVVERYGDRIGEHPVGTGPFRLLSWKRSSRIVLERNPRYRERRWDFAIAPELLAAQPLLARDARALRGRRLPLVDRVEVGIIEEGQPRWLSFSQGEQDLMRVPNEMATLIAPGRRLAPFLAQRGVRLNRTPMADVVLNYFNMEHPLVGGYTPEKVALRRAVSLAFDRAEFARAIFNDSAVRAQSPLAPGTFGYDPALRSALGESNLARAKALLDTFGYLDRDGDGWRETPQGEPLVLEMSASPSQLDRKQNEQMRRFLTAVGVRIEFRIAQWPELLKQSLAGKLMMWGFSWQLFEPDSDLLFGMAYGPNREQSNDARFALPEYDRLYEAQRRLPDGPERLALLQQMTRLLAAYMPYLLYLHRVRLDVAQPWVAGYARNPFTEVCWHLIDVDPAARTAVA